jgi:hypothetical protein
LTRFLLDLPEARGDSKAEVRVTLTLTDEEIVYVIGTSRETVTRQCDLGRRIKSKPETKRS